MGKMPTNTPSQEFYSHNRLPQVYTSHSKDVDDPKRERVLGPLQVLMEENYVRGEGLYCFFIDLEKVFHMIPHEYFLTHMDR